jgi:hypothetical protein
VRGDLTAKKKIVLLGNLSFAKDVGQASTITYTITYRKEGKEKEKTLFRKYFALLQSIVF